MARKNIQKLIEELRSWLPNYDSGPDSFPHTLYRILASLPGGDELEDMGYEPMPGIGWKEADLLGQVLTAIQDKGDVEDLVAGLIREEEEEVGEKRRMRDDPAPAPAPAPVPAKQPAAPAPAAAEVRTRPTMREHPYPGPSLRASRLRRR
jgi:hypothetical protein